MSSVTYNDETHWWVATVVLGPGVFLSFVGHTHDMALNVARASGFLI
jgi:hypothetical protein